jgi:diguanylate cyclase (GGDEF)-like protein
VLNEADAASALPPEGPERDQARDQRDQAGDQRDEAAGERDRTADARDRAGDRRDGAADERDEAAEQAAGEPETWAEMGMGSEAANLSAAARRAAASDRRQASQDRRAGAEERIQAEVDRQIAMSDRDASAREREDASVDVVTGVYLRTAGFIELERDIARVRRTGETLVVAFVDVDHLKAINDSRGHAAGDRMLLDVATTFKAQLRSHDLIIRYGGDEFVCALTGVTMAEASARLGLVNASLAAAPEHGSVTVGLAQLRAADSADDLVARADAGLYRERQRQRPASPNPA